jgi:hypothetical protein
VAELRQVKAHLQEIPAIASHHRQHAHHKNRLRGVFRGAAEGLSVTGRIAANFISTF